MLNDKALSIEKKLGLLIYKAIYNIMFNAYDLVRDRTNTIACGRKLVAIYRESGDTVQEGQLSIKLAQIYRSQSIYAEAKELYEAEQSLL